MPFPVVKTRLSEFESLLYRHKDVATLWDVSTNGGCAEVSLATPCTVDELLPQIELQMADGDFIYVYNEGIDDPTGEWDRTDYSAIPEVKSKELDDYIIRGSLG